MAVWTRRSKKQLICFALAAIEFGWKDIKLLASTTTAAGRSELFCISWNFEWKAINPLAREFPLPKSHKAAGESIPSLEEVIFPLPKQLNREKKGCCLSRSNFAAREAESAIGDR